MTATVSPQQALIYLMVLVSASDARMTDRELRAIGHIVQRFPAFRDFDPERLVRVAEEAGELLSANGGLEAVLELACTSLPDHLHETAYAVAVEVAAADDRVEPEEARVLQLIRNALRVDRLAAAAIERSARARHMTV
ncbi:MAG: tellurite resistance TerB family protein [Alphaproteobacteria bacterium]|nr:tellurite resistance TerB family protein [Alphaproteobacteria bacterium]